MHDPLSVAGYIVLPIPVRKWTYRSDGRWFFRRMRRSNPENLGEPVYPWWRLKGWECRLAGTNWGLYQLATVWHREPHGRDSGSVCKGRGWPWHVHHWRLQVHPWQALRRWLFDRCAICKRGFPRKCSVTSFSWDPVRPPWWAFWRSYTDLHHDECASLLSARRDRELDGTIIRRLHSECAYRAGESEPDALRRIYRSMEFPYAYRLMVRLGYEWDESHDNLVKRAQ